MKKKISILLILFSVLCLAKNEEPGIEGKMRLSFRERIINKFRIDSAQVNPNALKYLSNTNRLKPVSNYSHSIQPLQQSKSNVNISQPFSKSIITGSVHEEWVRTFASNHLPSEDYANDVSVNNNDEVIVTGVSFTSYSGADYFTIKYNERGDTLWTKRFNGTANGYDEATAIAVDRFDNVYVTGYSAIDLEHFTITTVQYKTDGEIGWIRSYTPASGTNGIPTSIGVSQNGDIYICGYFESSQNTDIAIIKYDRFGNLLWEKSYDGGLNGLDIAFSLAIDSSDGVIVGGASQNVLSGSDMLVLSYDSNGTLRWMNINPQSSNKRDAVTSVVVDSTGNVFATGYTANQYGQFDYRTAKYDLNGNQKWVNLFNGQGNGDDFAISIGIDQSSNIYITGSSFSTVSGFDFVTLSYDENGVIRWTAPFKGNAGYDDRATSLKVDRKHNQIFVCGLSNSRSGGPGDYATIRYNYNGIPLWMLYYNNQSNGNDYPSAMVSDKKGNVYVTGSSDGGETSYDYLTVKYKSVETDQWPTRFNNGMGSNGNSFTIIDSKGNIISAGNDSSKILVVKFDSTGKWQQQISVGNNGKACGLVIDSQDNYYLTGTTFNGLSQDYLTIKFNINGEIIWTKQYDGPAALNDKPSGIAVGKAGDVYVTGLSYGASTMSDIVTIKYNSEGEEQWIVRYNGSLNNRDSAAAIVLDSAGNVYVGGTTVRYGSSYDFIVIKYSNQGVEQWRTFYNGTGGGADFLKDMVTDAKNFIYVTGRSNGKGTFGDYATLKINYDGIIQWVARFDGPGNYIDDPSSIGVDKYGNVIVTGLCYSFSSGSNLVTVKYNASGGQMWSQVEFGNWRGSNKAASLAIDSDGNSYVTGTYSTSTTGLDIVTKRYSPTAYKDWEVSYNSYFNLDDEAKCNLLDEKHGYFYVGGSSVSSNLTTDIVILKNTLGGASDQLWPRRENGPGISYDDVGLLRISSEENIIYAGKSLSNAQNEDLLIFSYTPDGKLIWNVLEKNSTGGDINISDMVLDKTGKIDLSATNYDNNSCDIGIYRYDLNGDHVWQQRYDGVTNSYDFSSSIAVDDSSNVISVGYSAGLTSYDYVINKYDSTGNLKWNVIYDGDSKLDDLAYAVVVDSTGNIYVTGLSVGYSTMSDYLTIKLNPGGEIKWIARWNDSMNGYDKVEAISIDKNNNIVVSGYATGIDSSYDIVTVKYDSSGNELFSIAYIGIPHSNQIMCAMTIDTEGNILIAGQTNEIEINSYEYLILKYDANGNLLFKQTYSASNGLESKPSDIAIDVEGGIYVTGKSKGSDLTYDYATVKLNSNGEIIWVARYSSAVGCNDEAKSIKVDPAGNIYITGTSSTDSWSVINSIKYRQTTVGIVENEEGKPKEFKMYQNYPNPFNPVTTIKYVLPQKDHVIIKIFNVMGQLIQTISDSDQDPGTHQIRFDASHISSGIYFCRLSTANGYISTKKLIVLK
ncbi:MAG: SBBP repeat-containing protein [Ignavibacteriales bacterium]|nr:SBBP repeat-containing protein [Ignavibacteriales bacterium]